MITVILGTNRPNSYTRLVTNELVTMLRSITTEEVAFIGLDELNVSFFHHGMYAPSQQTEALAALQDKLLIPAHKWIVVSPEYNGSFPGVLKLFLDAVSIRAYKDTFAGKKICLIGVASGRAGNLRGMDHLRDIFSHVGSFVQPAALPLSTIKASTDEATGTITDDAMREALLKHLQSFLAF